MDMQRFINIGIVNEAEVDKTIEIKNNNYINSVTFFYEKSESWFSWRAGVLVI